MAGRATDFGRMDRVRADTGAINGLSDQAYMNGYGLTGIILEVSRTAGETAPIMFTGAAAFLPFLPQSVFDQTMAMSLHLFVVSTQVPGVPEALPYGVALVLIGMALLNKPRLLIADEPGTALDVTTQIEVLATIRDIVEQFNTAAIYITHDLAVVAEDADAHGFGGAAHRAPAPRRRPGSLPTPGWVPRAARSSWPRCPRWPRTVFGWSSCSRRAAVRTSRRTKRQRV